jgi:hypothetical protein
MFVVYARSFGGPRRPLGHFAGLKAAQTYADSMNGTLPTDELSIVEQPDAGRKNFVDRPEVSNGDTGAGFDATIPVEALAAPDPVTRGGKR